MAPGSPPRRLPSLLLAGLAYGVGVASLALFAVFLWFGPLGLVDLGLGPPGALVLDGALSLLFFLQHSGMVRRRFRAWLSTRVAPTHAMAVYALVSALTLTLVLLLWQPSGRAVSTLEGPWRLLPRALFLLAGLGFAWVGRALRHLDTFGVDPILDALGGRPPKPRRFVVRGPYRYMRHPLYLFTLALLWATPDLTADRLLLATLWTLWIVAACRWEERDLVAAFGPPYRDYQRRVPMLLPWRPPRPTR